MDCHHDQYICNFFDEVCNREGGAAMNQPLLGFPYSLLLNSAVDAIQVFNCVIINLLRKVLVIGWGWSMYLKQSPADGVTSRAGQLSGLGLLLRQSRGQGLF